MRRDQLASPDNGPFFLTFYFVHIPSTVGTLWRM